MELAVQNPDVITDWDLFLGMVANAINTRKMSHGFSPAEVLLGFNPHVFGLRSVEEGLLQEVIDHDQKPPSEEQRAEAAESHLVRLEEVRDRLRDTWNGRELEQSQRARKKQSLDGDLVLLRDVKLDGVHGQKLDARWRGPFKIARVLAKHRSVILSDLTTDMQIGKHHYDHLKLFVPRNGSESPAAEQEASWLARCNKETAQWSKAARQKQKRGDGADEEGVKLRVSVSWLWSLECINSVSRKPASLPKYITTINTFSSSSSSSFLLLPPSSSSFLFTFQQQFLFKKFLAPHSESFSSYS